MADSWDYGKSAAEFFERLRTAVVKDNLPPHLHDAFERKHVQIRQYAEDQELALIEDRARFDEILAFVRSTFGKVTTAEEAFFYNTIRKEFNRGGDSFVGYVSRAEETVRRVFGFQGEYHLAEFMFIGITGVRGMRRAETIWMAVWCAWIIAVVTVATALSIALYTYLVRPFEIIVISLLLLICCNSFLARYRVRMASLESQSAAASYLAAIASLLGRQIKEEEARIDSLTHDMTKAKLKLFGYQLTAFAASAVALWHLAALFLAF